MIGDDRMKNRSHEGDLRYPQMAKTATCSVNASITEPTFDMILNGTSADASINTLYQLQNAAQLAKKYGNLQYPDKTNFNPNLH
jgi:hypothetical protein